MAILQIHSTHTLTGKCRSKYRGLASDSLYLYCTVPDHKEIHRYDSCFNNRKVYSVCRPYTSICYDICDQCFWALANDAEACIFQLDLDFQEMRCMSLSFPGVESLRLTGISSGPSAAELFVSTTHLLAKVDKKSERLSPIKKGTDQCCQYLCTQTLCSDYLYASCCNEHPEITLTSCSGKVLLRCFPSDNYMPLDFALQCASKNCQHFQLYILVMDCCKCCHILKCIISLHEHKRKPRDCSDLIESIALVEASLAHILNAEGEKLQKIIACSNDFDEIMAVNQSINCTLKNVTDLEKVLLEKLRTAAHICPD